MVYFYVNLMISVMGWMQRSQASSWPRAGPRPSSDQAIKWARRFQFISSLTTFTYITPLLLQVVSGAILSLMTFNEVSKNISSSESNTNVSF